MSRRSSRLVSGGYYNSDEESDSSSVTTISYRENPVKVFKKKAGIRKAAAHTPSRANSNARSAPDPPPAAAAASDQYEGLSPSPSTQTKTQTQTTMRTVSYVSTTATPRPPLTPSSSRGQTPPPRRPSVPPEKSLYRPGLHLRPDAKKELLSQSGVDSSGYSSSEGPHRRPPDTSSTSKSSGAPSAGYWDRVSWAFFSLMDSVSLMVDALQSHMILLTASAAKASVSGRVRKACGLILLFLIALLCVWLLLPFFTSLVSRMAATKTSSHTKHKSQPVLHAATPHPHPPPPHHPPHPQPDAKHPAPVVDSAVVSAAVEARIQRLLDSSMVSAAVDAQMKHLLEEQQLKQEHLLSQVKERLQLEVQEVKAQLEVVVVDSEERLRLEQQVSGVVERMVEQQVSGVVEKMVEQQVSGVVEKMVEQQVSCVVEKMVEQQVSGVVEKMVEQQVSGVVEKMVEHQTDSRSTAAGLRLRVQALEAQNAKLSQEWSSLQLRPPPAPCPDTSKVQHQLTPELQRAMEKWLSDRVQDDGGSCSNCGRPRADKMADFALETQGASVISTRCSETYRIRSACVTLFGIPLWYPSESPRTVIQGYPVLLPGKCWAFHGVQGSLVISLSHPITLTHVTLDHLPRCNAPAGRIDSAPKDFEVYGMKDDVEEGTLLGTFTYDEDGASTQTFTLSNPSDVVHRCVELRVLSNWGHVEYTCLYRFRVHGQIAAT